MPISQPVIHHDGLQPDHCSAISEWERTACARAGRLMPFRVEFFEHRGDPTRGDVVGTGAVVVLRGVEETAFGIERSDGAILLLDAYTGGAIGEVGAEHRCDDIKGALGLLESLYGDTRAVTAA